MKTFLYNLAHTRAGDRGDVLNIGVIARRRELYPLIAAELPASRVKAFFGTWCRGEVLRYELPKLGALNFVLYGALDGGALSSLR
ncbi:MAG: hypothetical protein IT373_38190, partial [Polyangiaceae bacterium]|nr:hypothetical protein [Polyangiaceae bacterium]